jgi:NADH:ubiquinone oxidoreductase subunit E
LTVDYFLARSRTARDEARIAELQQQVQSDASHAPALEAEQKRITSQRDARRARIDLLAILLIAGATLFLTGANRLVTRTRRKPTPPVPLVQLRAAPSARGRRAAPTPDPPALDLKFVDQLVAREGRAPEAAIPILQAIQEHYRYLPDEALRRVCELTEITPAQIAGTSSFYARFRRSPAGKHTIRVCHGTACHVSGARQITEELRRALGISEGADTDAGRMFTIEEVACLGCCSLAPVLMIDEHTAGKLTPLTAADALDIVEPA